MPWQFYSADAPAVNSGSRDTLIHAATQCSHNFPVDKGRDITAQGRDLGIMFRTRASTRSISLVFVDGAEDKVARIREILPDAVFASRSELSGATWSGLCFTSRKK